MKKVVCFGEIMGRLNPEGYLRIKQAHKFELSFAGAEANVAVSLATLGLPVEFVSKIPKNDLTEALLFNLRGHGVALNHMAYGGNRLGLYFVEKGASQRPSKVIYDRQHSAIAEAVPSDFDWNKIFSDASWFHFTGITPALSDNLVQICLEACQTAKEYGVTISCDLNYRNNLWSTEKAEEVMDQLMQYVDVCISNEEDAEKVFGINSLETDVQSGKLNHDSYVDVAKQLYERFNLSHVAITLRGSISASDNEWAGLLFTEEQSYFSRNYLIHLVDRVGGGDSFGAGLIYGLISNFAPQKAIEFATAASCLKQATEFDFNISTLPEIIKLMGGDASGRVIR